MGKSPLRSYSKVAPNIIVKMGKPTVGIKMMFWGYFALFLHTITYCGALLESPQRGDSYRHLSFCKLVTKMRWAIKYGVIIHFVTPTYFATSSSKASEN